MDLTKIEVPDTWRQLPIERLHGVVLVIGGSDTGKSTLAHYLHHKMISQGKTTAYLDGDPGQGTLGPPTTMNMTLGGSSEQRNDRGRKQKQWFVGSISPKGHMLPMVVGARRLVEAAEELDANCVVCDTTGLIDANQGGVALKLAKIDLLRPNFVIAIQWEYELEILLKPLRRVNRLNLVEMRPASSVIERNRNLRQKNRANRYADYFSAAKEQKIIWTQKAVLPRPNFLPHRVLGLEGEDGFNLGIGILLQENRKDREITLLTPVDAIEAVETVRIGDVTVDPSTYEDKFV